VPYIPQEVFVCDRFHNVSSISVERNIFSCTPRTARVPEKMMSKDVILHLDFSGKFHTAHSAVESLFWGLVDVTNMFTQT
jgi:hypothetical protein